MLQEISETEMPSIRFQDLLRFSWLSPVSHKATLLKATLGSEFAGAAEPIFSSFRLHRKKKEQRSIENVEREVARIVPTGENTLRIVAKYCK